MTQHFRPEAEAAKYRKSDSSVALAPVLGGTGCLGHVLMSAKGFRAFDRNDRELAWPNSRMPARYFGKFNSEAEAQKWITAHAFLTKPPSEPFVESPPIISDPNASPE